MRFRGKYDEAAQTRARVNARVRNEQPSLTQQSATVDCDLNVLVKRFGIDKGPLPVVPVDPRFYGDFDDQLDLGTAMTRVAEARDRFMTLPPDVRAEFNNDPAELWLFVNDPANVEAAVEMGLLKRSSPAAASSEPTPTPATPPPYSKPLNRLLAQLSPTGDSCAP